jgi:hypothetical protein
MIQTQRSILDAEEKTLRHEFLLLISPNEAVVSSLGKVLWRFCITTGSDAWTHSRGSFITAFLL